MKNIFQDILEEIGKTSPENTVEREKLGKTKQIESYKSSFYM